jgi:hypothetical protein
LKRPLPDGLAERVAAFLGKDGLDFFRACKKYCGTLSPVFVINEPRDESLTPEAIQRMAEDPQPRKPGAIPISVHFQHGMQVRNFMRRTGLCEGWDAHDFDDTWQDAVQAALDKESA